MIELLSRLNRIEDRRFNFVDTPGHSDFIFNAMQGASLVDVAILMIDPIKFAATFEAGTTKQHIEILKGQGIKDIIVCINKMDMIGWKEETYKDIVDVLRAHFAERQLDASRTRFVPISAFKGENLTRPIGVEWYRGDSLLATILKVKPTEAGLAFKPARLTVQGIFRGSQKKRGNGVHAKVQGGCVSIGNKLLAVPANVMLTVKAIYVGEEKRDIAIAGDTVDLVVTAPTEEEFDSLKKGDVLCSETYPIPLVRKFKATLTTLKMKHPMLVGSRYSLHVGFHTESAVIKKILFEISPLSRKKPRLVANNSVAVVEVHLDSRMPLERYANFETFGTFQLSDEFKIIANGTIEELVE